MGLERLVSKCEGIIGGMNLGIAALWFEGVL